MFQQAFKNIDDVLRLECSTELDYVEQTSWLLFLKYLDGLEEDKAAEAELSVKNPQGKEEVVYRDPQSILDEIARLDAESRDVLARVGALLK